VLTLWLFLTIVLGFLFLGFQAYEYHHAYTEMGLKLTSGVYGSTFFMLTGFHGLHVTIWRDHADGDALPRDEGPFHRRASFRLSRLRRGTGTSSTWSGCCCIVLVYWLA
jgi:hypothetical protein